MNPELTPIVAAALHFIAHNRRAWTPVVEMEAAGYDADTLAELVTSELACVWDRDRRGNPLPAEPSLVLTPWGLHVADRAVRERWISEVGIEPGRRGLARKVSCVTPFYGVPEVAKRPETFVVAAEPAKWSRDAALPLPGSIIDRRPGPLDELIEKEEAQFKMITRFDSETGEEVTAPLELLGGYRVEIDPRLGEKRKGKRSKRKAKGRKPR